MEKMLLYQRFKIHQHLSKGKFGNIYIAHDYKTKQTIAMKIFIDSHRERVINEYNLLKSLYINIDNLIAVPCVYYLGYMAIDDKYVMTMELLSLSLTNIYMCLKSLSDQTIINVAYLVIRLLKHIHSFGIVHRDIKPCNIMIGCNKQRSCLYLIDYGIAYSPPINETSEYGFIGNLLCGPISAHRHRSQTYKDDIESVVYMMYVLSGKVDSWLNYDKEHIFQSKSNMNDSILHYVRKLKYRDAIDYNYILSLLAYDKDHVYEWMDPSLLRGCINETWKNSTLYN